MTNQEDRATRHGMELQLRNRRLEPRLERLAAIVNVKLAQQRRREGR